MTFECIATFFHYLFKCFMVITHNFINLLYLSCITHIWICCLRFILRMNHFSINSSLKREISLYLSLLNIRCRCLLNFDIFIFILMFSKLIFDILIAIIYRFNLIFIIISVPFCPRILSWINI